MSTTFTAFCTKVQTMCNDNSANMLAKIVEWANEFHAKICNRRNWRWLDLVSDAITIKTANYPFAYETSLLVSTALTPAKKILDVVDMSYTPNQSLLSSTSEQIRASFQNYPTYTGIPDYWYIEAGKLKLFPNVDATGRSYTIRFRAKHVVYPSASANPLLIPDDEGVPVLLHAVMSQVWMFLDDSRATSEYKLYESGLQDMEDNDPTEPIIYDRDPVRFVTKLPDLSLDS
ncbi:MAG: hypothetical protein PHQ91_12325 [Thermoanaerobaculaceae bacterium]|nr:hypothetical protein [Thermoanaerobaculaceae bacterium]